MADENDPRPGDDKVALLRKILARLHGNNIGSGTYEPYRPGDMPNDVLRKILTQL